MADSQRHSEPMEDPKADLGSGLGADLGSELAQLRATLATQQAELATQRETIAQQQVAITALQRADGPAEVDSVQLEQMGEMDSESESDSSTRGVKTSRRNLLVGAAGVAAAGAAAAAIVALSEPPVAHAANNGAAINNPAHTANTSSVANTTGSPLVLGGTNDADATTILNNTNGSAPSPVLQVEANELGSYATAIYGLAFAAGGAVPGAKTGAKKGKGGLPVGAVVAGFSGAGGGGAVPAAGSGGGAGGVGVTGVSDIGFGMEAVSFGNVDLVMDGTGRMWQYPQSQAGAPTTGTYNQGESIRDANGELWICVAAGAPGTWARMAHTQTGFAGGTINFLSVPIRVIDTRSGQNPAAPLPTTKAPLASGQTYTFQITGTSVGGSSVPAGAVGIYANVTVIFPTNGGNLIFYPADQAQPQSSTINYSQGAVVGNMAFVRLSASGAVKVFVNGPANTDVVVDIAGFIV